jgi:hypothetical protein
MTFDQKIELWTLACSAFAALGAWGVPPLLGLLAERKSKAPQFTATWRGLRVEKGAILLEVVVAVVVPYCVESVAITDPMGSTLAQASPTELAGGPLDAARYAPKIEFAHRMRLPTDGPLRLQFAVKGADPTKSPFVVRIHWRTDRRKGTSDVRPVLV